MKNTINTLLVVAAILAIVFGFILFWQKQQHEHEEKMHASLLPLSLSPETNSEIPVTEDNNTTSQKISETLQSAIAFILGIFSKL